MRSTIGTGFVVFVALPSALLAGCGDTIIQNYIEQSDATEIPEPEIPEVVVDTDGDGISDEDEIQLHATSPILADTDGDGLSDYQEIVEYGFNPELNPIKFNPLVADLPKLGIVLTSPPAVALHLSHGDGEVRIFETTRSEESASTVTTSTTDTNSHAVEMTHTAGIESGVEFGTGGVTGNVKLSYEFSQATTDEETHSYTAEQAAENRRALSAAEAYQHSTEVTASGGILMVTVEIENRGNLAFRLENIILGAVVPDLDQPGVLHPVGNLVLDTGGNYTSFPAVTIPPGGRLQALNFINDGLDLVTAKKLLADSSSLVILASSYEMTDALGRPFAFNLTDVGAKTATIVIDYSGHGPTERYMVATNADASRPGITVEEAFTSILRLPYEAGATPWRGESREGLIALRDDAEPVARRRAGGHAIQPRRGELRLRSHRAHGRRRAPPGLRGGQGR
jgi:hypothetical protein